MATVDAVTQKVQRMLANGFSDVRLTKTGFGVPYGSSQVFLEVRDWGKDKNGEPQTLVYLWAPMGREIPMTPELFKWVATTGQEKYYGSTHAYPGEDGKPGTVILEHTLLGDFLDPMELETAVSMLYFSADQLDDIIHDTFGGKRYTDA
jgi:hypothetical protein